MEKKVIFAPMKIETFTRNLNFIDLLEWRYS